MTRLFLSFLIGLALASCGQAQPNDMPPPQVPTGYLYRVTTAAPGQVVYVCGQRPFDANGSLVGPGNLGAQTRQVFENLKASLQTVDMTLRNVTQVTYSVKEVSTRVDSSKTQALNTISALYFATTPGLVDMKGVSLLGRDDVLIEIEVIAVK
jgi:enamine deaminase RidA (YjgF/YER057c/UK114 family)